MVWNKTPEKTVQEIQKLLQDFSLRYQDIAERTGVSVSTVYEINSKMPEAFKKE